MTGARAKEGAGGGGHGFPHPELHSCGHGEHRARAVVRAPRVRHAALPDGDRAVRPGGPVRRRRRRRRRAASPSRALDHRGVPDQARRRKARRAPGLPGPALERPRPHQGRRALRPRGHPRRVRGARGLDDVEMRAAPAALRRREGRRALRSACAEPHRARAPHPAIHVGAAPVHRAAGGHPRAGHGDERADDGLDDGHLLDAARPRGAGDRHGQADRDRRQRVPPRGDGRGGRDGRGARVRTARLEARGAAVRRPGIRQCRRDRRPGARRPRRDRDRGLRHLGRLLRPRGISTSRR